MKRVLPALLAGFFLSTGMMLASEDWEKTQQQLIEFAAKQEAQKRLEREKIKKELEQFYTEQEKEKKLEEEKEEKKKKVEKEKKKEIEEKSEKKVTLTDEEIKKVSELKITRKSIKALIEEDMSAAKLLGLFEKIVEKEKNIEELKKLFESEEKNEISLLETILINILEVEAYKKTDIKNDKNIKISIVNIDTDAWDKDKKALFDFIRKKLKVDVKKIRWSKMQGGQTSTINFALFYQNNGLIDYLLDLGGDGLIWDKKRTTDLLLNLSLIFVSTPPSLNIYDANFVFKKENVYKVVSGSRIQPLIGLLPCFIKILDYLKNQNKDLKKITLPVLENNRSGFMIGLLYQLNYFGNPDFDKIENISLFEMILAAFEKVKTFGDIKLHDDATEKDEKLFRKRLKLGLSLLKDYVKEFKIKDDLLDKEITRLENALSGKKKKVEKEKKKEIEEKSEKKEKKKVKKEEKKPEKKLPKIDLETIMPTETFHEYTYNIDKQDNYGKLLKILENTTPENLNSYFFSPKILSQEEKDDKKTIKEVAKNRQDKLNQFLHKTGVIDSGNSCYDQTGGFYASIYQFDPIADQKTYSKYIDIASILVNKITDSYDLMSDKEAGKYGILEMVLITQKPSLIKNFLERNNSFIDNRYNKKDKTLNINLKYIFEKYSGKGKEHLAFPEDDFYKKSPLKDYLIHFKFAEQFGFLPGFIKLLEQIKTADTSIKHLNEIKIKHKKKNLPVIFALLHYYTTTGYDNALSYSFFETILNIFIKSDGSFGEGNTFEQEMNYKNLRDNLNAFIEFLKENYLGTYPKPTITSKNQSLKFAIDTKYKDDIENNKKLTKLDETNKENWKLRKKQLNDLKITTKLKGIIKKLNKKLSKKKIDENIFEEK